jgi:predicted ATPase/DNA-binding NarL/FixJ family response regulator
MGVPDGLPVELSSFVGREAQVERGVALAARTRLLSLVGPGGVGKTRLALRVASRLTGTGTWWVELAALVDRAQIEAAVSRTVGLPTAVGPVRWADVLAGFLGGARAVLVLDNCEHLLDDVAPLVDDLLRACPGATVLATSREPLGVEGELVWRVPPLETPPEGAAAGDTWGYEAVRLFVTRATAAHPDFAPEPRDAAAVAGICRALDGMPLAVELAAARVGAMSVAAVLTALDDRFRLLTGGPRPASPRLRSLRASLEWSSGLCAPAERVLLRRLGVFVGGFDAAGAVRIAGFGPLDPAAVPGILAELVAKSLVQREPDDGVRSRWRLLETVRVFARDRAADAGETDVLDGRHLAWAAELAEELAPATARCDVEALDRLERALPDLRRALDHAAAEPADDHGLRLVTALGYFWARRGHGIPGAPLAEAVLAAAPTSTAARGWAWWSTAFARFYGGAFPEAAEAAATALADADAAGDRALAARARAVLGGLANFTDPDAARALLHEALASTVATADVVTGREAVLLISFSHLVQHRPADSAPFVERLHGYASAQDDLSGRTWTHLHRAMAAQGTGELGAARESYRAAAVLAERVADPLLLLYAYSGAANIALATGRFADLAALADAMHRPELRFAALTLAFAEALPGIATIASDPAAGTGALVAGGAAILPYVPFDAARLVLEGARHALARDDHDAAEHAATVALDAAGALGSAHAGSCRAVLARIGAARGDDPAAVETLAHAGLAEIEDARLWADVPDALTVLGAAALDTDRVEEGTRLLAAAHGIRHRSGRVDPAAATAEADRHRATALLGDRFDDVWATGAALDAPQAVAYARRARGPRRRPRSGWDSLTPTELDVARLVAAGHANPDIAERLFVSRSTVKTHLVHTYAKLGLASRAELAAAAVRHGLG